MTDHGSFANDVLTFERVMRTADRYPHRVAIDTGPARITYAEFAESVHARARHLASLCLPRQSRVGLVADKTANSYCWYLACWHQGHVVVPLSPEHPAASNAEI